MPPKDNFQAAIPTTALAGLIYSSPLDFTAAFNASDSLTITFPGGAVYVPADGADILWLGLRYVNAAGQDFFFDNTSYDFDYESGTNLLTITPDPGLAAGGQYGAMLLGPSRDAAALAAIDALLVTIQDLAKALNQQAGMGLPGSYFSGVDFVAARHDADELNCTGIPGSPSKSQFISVTEKVDGATRQKWTAGVDQFEWDAANQRLQVVGAAFSADASAEWIVTYIDQVKGYDLILNAMQHVQINARSLKFRDKEPLFDAESLDTALTSVYVDAKGQIWLGLRFVWTTDSDTGAYTLTIRATEDPTETGTTDHQLFTGDWAYPDVPGATVVIQGQDVQIQVTSTGTAITTYGVIRFQVAALNRLRFLFTETKPIAPAVNGVLTASTTSLN